MGLIPGETDEYVIVPAHLDGYFESANDNAGGLASALALARYFSDRSGQPDRRPLKRNLVFVATSAHHEFSDGSRAFIAAHPEILEKTVLVFNIEHPSSIDSYYRGPLKLERVTVPGQLIVTTTQGKRSLTISNANPLLLSIYQEAVDRYGLVVDAMVGRRPTGDAYDFFLAGTPVVQILDANLWFHSSGDRSDTIHANGLERATRLYAYVLDHIDRSGWDELREQGTLKCDSFSLAGLGLFSICRATVRYRTGPSMAAMPAARGFRHSARSIATTFRISNSRGVTAPEMAKARLRRSVSYGLQGHADPADGTCRRAPRDVQRVRQSDCARSCERHSRLVVRSGSQPRGPQCSV